MHVAVRCVACISRWHPFCDGGFIHGRKDGSGFTARDASLLLLAGWFVILKGESDGWWEGGVPGRRGQNLHAGAGLQSKHVWGGFFITKGAYTLYKYLIR